MQSLTPYLFWIVAGLTGMSAIAVVASQNIVRSATWLLFTLGGVACIFFLLGADFVGAIQLLVYVGGTLVLVVFGVMLTAQGPFINMRTSAAEWAISTVVGLLLFAVLVVSALPMGASGARHVDHAAAQKGNGHHRDAKPAAQANHGNADQSANRPFPLPKSVQKGAPPGVLGSDPT